MATSFPFSANPLTVMLTLFSPRSARIINRFLTLALLAVGATGPLTQSYGQAFRHTAAASNIDAGQPWITILDNALTNNLSSKLLFVSQEWGSAGPYNPHSIGVWYNGTKWTIFNQDRVTMPPQAKFNVLALDPGDNVFVHTAGGANITGQRTTLDHPLLNNNPNARILVTQNWGDAGPYNANAVGAYYQDSRWSIENGAAMPVGAKFNVWIENGISAVNATAPSTNVYIFDDPATNNQPNALVFATQYWTGVYNPHEIGTWYTNNKWSVFNQDLADMPTNARFFVYTTGTAVPEYTFTTLAGLAGNAGSTDGIGSAARFNKPLGAAVDSAGNVYVADDVDHTIRKITRSGVVSVLAGSVGLTGSADGTGTAARFNIPFGVAVDSAGNVYVGEIGNHTIRKITSAGVVTTLAGSAGSFGSADGPAISTARFKSPRGVAVDGAGNVYVADFGNNTVRKISGGSVSTLAGSAGSAGTLDGVGSAARFDGLSGVAVDNAGNVYVADMFNQTIRKVTTGGSVTTLAGKAGAQGSTDGIGSLARFKNPHAIAVDSAGTNIYVADTNNYTVRRITSTGFVTTIAGSPGVTGSSDGTGSFARFNDSFGIAVHSDGTVYVTEAINKTVRWGSLASGTPVITGQPLSQSVAAGASVTFSVTATGTPAPAFQWRKNGVAISGQTTNSLTLNPVAVSDAATYTALVISPSGMVMSAPAVLTVDAGVSAPTITAQPVSQTVIIGTSATLSVTATATPAPTYQWQKNGVAIAGATAASLTLNPVAVADAGSYTVVVTNSAGAVTSAAAVLTVGVAVSAPTITAQPVSQTVIAGASATLSVTATGTPTPTFQWQKNGVAIAGATGASLTLNPVVVGDAGSYTVVLTNSAGAVTSAAAVLTVNPATAAPTISTQPLSQTITAGVPDPGRGPPPTQVFLSVAATGSPAPTYQWQKDGVAIAGATNATFQFNALNSSFAGTYTVVVSNSAGTVTSAPAALAVIPSSALSNLSVRTALAANQVLTVGAVMRGGSKNMVLRAAGPALNKFALAGMTDPRLDLFTTGATATATNDDWPSSLAATFTALGAFPFDVGSKDAGLAQVLTGSFTAQARGTGTGTILVEAYDAAEGTATRLVNLSARNRVGTGSDILIAGFSLSGIGTKQVLIRAVGPGLAGFGVQGTLADPRLQVFNSAGAVIAENDNWDALLSATFTQVGAFVLLPGSRDAALVVTLAAGASYTVQVSGVNSGTGEALIELYEVF
jgi:hypothetical protein